MTVVAGSLYIISAPSGAGKTSLIKALLDVMTGIKVSVSHTTRTRRVGEVDGQDYHFIDKTDFESLLTQNQFLEHAKVFDYYYGTSQQVVADLLAGGTDVILEIDWQGAQQVRQHFDDVIGIFIMPPSKQELAQRLRGRGQDSDAIIQRRMSAAVNEMQHHEPFDYLVINDDFKQALLELQWIVKAQRLQMKNQQQRHLLLLAELTEN